MCVHEKHYQVLPTQMLPMSALVHELYDRWYIYIDHQGRDTIQEEIIGKLSEMLRQMSWKLSCLKFELMTISSNLTQSMKLSPNIYICETTATLFRIQRFNQRCITPSEASVILIGRSMDYHKGLDLSTPTLKNTSSPHSRWFQSIFLKESISCTCHYLSIHLSEFYFDTSTQHAPL